MFSLLNVNKPTGLSSRSVVTQVEALVSPVRAGHTGTLDPLASGVLVLCLGRATRLVSFIQQHPKRYRGTFRLGERSVSDDTDSEVERLVDPREPPREEVEAALPRFRGRIQQRPPDFSAVKVDGKRAYKLARKGREVRLQPREVEVYSLEIVSYAYPELTLDIACGSGTYIRSLGRDLAEFLGTAAVMSALQRTAIGPFTLATAVELGALTAETLPENLRPTAEAVSGLPHLTVTADEQHWLYDGRTLPRPGHGFSGDVAALNQQGELVSILRPRDADGLRPWRNFGRNN